MVAVRNRIDALKSRDLMRAAIAAPFWWEDLAGDLQRQVIRLHLAISAGRHKNHISSRVTTILKSKYITPQYSEERVSI